MALVLGQRVSELLGEIVGQRLAATIRALDALRLQYPAYADALERRFLRQSALRLEAAEYQTLHDEGLIGQELYNDLRREVSSRAGRGRAAGRASTSGSRPASWSASSRCSQGLESGAARQDQRAAAAALRGPGRAADPRVATRGTRCTSSPRARSRSTSTASSIQLGRGDFFGELALLGGRERRADVTALGYCQLLVLDDADFRTLLATDPIDPRATSTRSRAIASR